MIFCYASVLCNRYATAINIRFFNLERDLKKVSDSVFIGSYLALPRIVWNESCTRRSQTPHQQTSYSASCIICMIGFRTSRCCEQRHQILSSTPSVSVHHEEAVQYNNLSIHTVLARRFDNRMLATACSYSWRIFLLSRWSWKQSTAGVCCGEWSTRF